MATLYIKKAADGYFEFTLNGDSANKITNTRNDLTAIGNELHFKTANGANIIQNQQIYPADCTLDVGGTIYSFTSVQDAFSDLKAAGYFDWMFGTGSREGVDRFEDLLDTFNYAGNNGKTVKVNETLQRLDPVEYRLIKKFTDLDDTPKALSPNKMIVTNIDGSAIVYADLPAAPEQFLNSVGSFRYQDLLGQTTPQAIPSNTDIVIINDASGSKTNLNNNPYGISTVYIPEDNAFDFSDLSIGDTLNLRVDLSLQTTGANQNFAVKAKIGIGSPSEESKVFAFSQVKSAGTYSFSISIPFDIANADVQNNPAQILITSDASCNIANKNYYIEIIRKNINITEITTTAAHSLQEVTEVGDTTTLPITIGTFAEHIEYGSGSLIVKLLDLLPFIVYFPEPNVDGHDVILVSLEQLAQLQSDLSSAISSGDSNTLNSAISYADSKVEDRLVDGITDRAPSQNAVFDAIAAAMASATIPDASTSVKGKLKLAGDLSGTADLPTVPGLATKQNTLVSGTNIKTINGTSILGSGDLSVGTTAKTRKDISGPYTIISSDKDKILYLAAGTTITIPSGLTANQEYETFQWFSGQSSFIASGTTLKMIDYATASNYGQNARVFISYVDTETYNLSGDLSMI